MRDYAHAEALAERAIELAEQHQIRSPGEISRCVLGHVRAQLGRTSEGVGLIRRGMADLLETGVRVGITRVTTWLVAAQECQGTTAEALETIEQALRVNPDELVNRPEALRIRGELRLSRAPPDWPRQISARLSYLRAVWAQNRWNCARR
jgi:tetratricopeptide (TPR) repeat protein